MSIRLEIKKTKFEGLIVLQRNLLGDNRGYLERLYCMRELNPILQERKVVQINHTLTEKAGAVRGMHFQHPPYAETKLVSCIRGKVCDIAIDLRRNSSTFLKYHSEILSAENHKTLLIPEGFAHGFQTLTENSEMLYFHTIEYNQQFEDALNVRDPFLNFQWPLSITDISERDRKHTMIDKEFKGLIL